MPKQSNGDPHDNKRRRPISSQDQDARLKEMGKLGTRGMLLRAVEMLGDERVSDDQLRKVLMILGDVGPGESPGT